MDQKSGKSAPRVLVIDDDELIVEFLTEVLTMWGPFEADPCEVHTAGSVAEALEKLAGHTYDFMILDMVLGDGNGLQVLAALQKSESPLPVFVLSAHDAPEMRRRCIEMGAVAFLRKGDGVDPLIREVLALLRELDKRAALAAPEETPARLGRVLVVDDDPLVCDALDSMLKLLENVEVRTTFGGRAGLAAAEEWHPDVILLDITMPDIDGRHVLSALEDRGIMTRVIIMSAIRDHDLIKKCVELGAVDYLPKPFEFALLQDVVQRHLALARQGAN